MHAVADGLADEAGSNIGQGRRQPVYPNARPRPDRHLDVDAVERTQDDRGRGNRLDDPALDDTIGGDRLGRGDEPCDREAEDETRPHGRIVTGLR